MARIMLRGVLRGVREQMCKRQLLRKQQQQSQGRMQENASHSQRYDVLQGGRVQLPGWKRLHCGPNCCWASSHEIH